MTKKRWFRFHIDQWFNGTFGMKANEIAAYATIMVRLYDNDGEIEYNIDELAMRSGMRPSSFKKASESLIFKRKKINLIDGKLTMNSVDEEIETRTKLGEKSFKSRSKVDKKSPKNPYKSKADDSHTKNRTQNTEEKEDFSYDFGGVCVSFSKLEVSNLCQAFPEANVLQKLSEESFIQWAINQDPALPKNVITKYFKSKNTAAQSDAYLKRKAVANAGDIAKELFQ